MVRLHCDRCGTEIKDKYYTINIYSYDVNPKDNWNTTTAASVSAYTISRNGMLAELNATKMYCSHCKDDIENYIKLDCNKENIKAEFDPTQIAEIKKEIDKTPLEINNTYCVHKWRYTGSSGNINSTSAGHYVCEKCGAVKLY